MKVLILVLCLMVCGCVSAVRFKVLEGEKSKLEALVDDLKASVKTYEAIFRGSAARVKEPGE